MAGTEAVSCRLVLPNNWPAERVLGFHQRGQAEAGQDVLELGLVWHGCPASLQVHVLATHADARLHVDAGAGQPDVPAFRPFLERILGLDQPVQALRAGFAEHPELGSLLEARPGLCIPQAVTPFDALSWAVIGQQISVAAATAVRQRLMEALGPRHSSGLVCPPDAARIAGATEPELRAAGLSRGKAATLQRLAAGVLDGTLPLDDWLHAATADRNPEELREQLLAVPGVGPWTANYLLLRGLGDLDSSLHGDLGVRRSLQRLLGSEARPSPAETATWLEQFRPWRALVAAHLWALPG